jgi:hypothetical protein
VTFWQALIVAMLWVVVPVAAIVIVGPVVDAIPDAVSLLLDKIQRGDDER